MDNRDRSPEFDCAIDPEQSATFRTLARKRAIPLPAHPRRQANIHYRPVDAQKQTVSFPPLPDFDHCEQTAGSSAKTVGAP
jgi:hypothetical protein